MKRAITLLFILILCISLTTCGGSSDKRYQNALEHIEAGERDEAIGELNKAIEADSGNADFYQRSRKKTPASVSGGMNSGNGP